jgi:hypothetical protein
MRERGDARCAQQTKDASGARDEAQQAQATRRWRATPFTPTI